MAVIHQAYKGKYVQCLCLNMFFLIMLGLHIQEYIMFHLMVVMWAAPGYAALAGHHFLLSSLCHCHLLQLGSVLSLFQYSWLTELLALELNLWAAAQPCSSSVSPPASVAAVELVVLKAVSGSQVASANGRKLVVGSLNPVLLCLEAEYWQHLARVGEEYLLHCCPSCLIYLLTIINFHVMLNFILLYIIYFGVFFIQSD